MNCPTCNKPKKTKDKRNASRDCASCSARRRQKGVLPWNKGLKTGQHSEARKIAISCGKQKIAIKDFNGFKQEENLRLRKYVNNIGLHTECFERDNYTCQKCNKRGGELNAHHIEAWAINIETRFNINNLICFCVGCHSLFHKTYGNKTTNKELILFITLGDEDDALQGDRD